MTNTNQTIRFFEAYDPADEYKKYPKYFTNKSDANRYSSLTLFMYKLTKDIPFDLDIYRAFDKRISALEIKSIDPLFLTMGQES